MLKKLKRKNLKLFFNFLLIFGAIGYWGIYYYQTISPKNQNLYENFISVPDIPLDKRYLEHFDYWYSIFYYLDKNLSIHARIGLTMGGDYRILVKTYLAPRFVKFLNLDKYNYFKLLYNNNITHYLIKSKTPPFSDDETFVPIYIPAIPSPIIFEINMTNVKKHL